MAGCDWIQPGVFRHDGIQFGMYINKDAFARIRDFELRDGDAIVASYPRTGSTFVHELVYLIYNKGNTVTAKETPLHLRVPMIEFSRRSVNDPFTDEPLNRLDEMTDERIIKTHYQFNMIPKSSTTKAVNLIYVVRNPKDTLVSFYHFYRANSLEGNFPGTFDEFLDLFYQDKLSYGNYFDHLRSWLSAAKEHRILIVQFEDLIKERKTEIKRIAEFCHKDLTDEEIDRIAKHTSFESMRDNPSTNYEDATEIDKTISPFMRNGMVGDFNSHFTEEQSVKFDEYYEKQMRDIDIDFQFRHIVILEPTYSRRTIIIESPVKPQVIPPQHAKPDKKCRIM